LKTFLIFIYCSIFFVGFGYSLSSSLEFDNSLLLSEYHQKNTRLPLLINTENMSILASRYSTFGSKIQVKTLNSINLPELKLFIPQNSLLLGEVQKIQKVQKTNGSFDLTFGYQPSEIAFSRLVLPNGYSLNLKAVAVELRIQSTKNLISRIFRNNSKTKNQNLWQKKIIFLNQENFKSTKSKTLKNKLLRKKYDFDLNKGENIYVQINSITN